jgi:hypothetical protein
METLMARSQILSSEYNVVPLHPEVLKVKDEEDRNELGNGKPG